MVKKAAKRNAPKKKPVKKKGSGPTATTKKKAAKKKAAKKAAKKVARKKTAKHNSAKQATPKRRVKRKRPVVAPLPPERPTKRRAGASGDFHAKRLVDAFVREYAKKIRDYSIKYSHYDSYKAITKLGPEQCAEVLSVLLKSDAAQKRPRSHANHTLTSLVCRRKLALTDKQVVEIAKAIDRRADDYYGADPSLVGVLEKYAVDHSLPEAAIRWLAKAREQSRSRSSEARKAGARLQQLVAQGAEEPEINSGEAWSDAAIAALSKMTAKKRAVWNKLLHHCQTASGGSPSEKWLESARSAFRAVGAADFGKRIREWFPLVDKPRTEEVETTRYRDPNLFLDDRNSDLLKGLMWVLPLTADPELAREISPVAITAYKKVPGVGPRAVSLGNACLYALGQMPDTSGVAQMAILKVRVKFGTAQRLIEKALLETAERVGIPRDELEEMSVPVYGLDEVGLRREQLGDCIAEIVVAGAKPEIRWLKSDGTPQKSVPASVKSKFAAEMKELRQAAKDIEKMLPAQTARIEQTYLQKKAWDVATWEERYINHPLTGVIARRLIWQFREGTKTVAGLFRDGKYVGSDGKRITFGKKAKVRLWHPLHDATRAVVAWRDYLETHEIKQPFKQAHREIYVLTDAERRTEVYSNRFAAHVLKQHQFNALCAARGWKNQLRLLVDDEFPPSQLLLPAYGLRAEYWVEGVGSEYGEDTNDTGTFYYLVTDQVRFYEEDAPANYAHATGGGYTGARRRRPETPVKLAKIPKLVFSEVMRDVDLYVGVSSVGNDPNWNDGGPGGRYLDYWQSYSFGKLNATAATRKDILQRLIPRLAIADRCAFEDRFLVVRGDIRTYKIHLGSGNILMKPNDQYLCIVPKQYNPRGTDRIFLPFDGDKMLSIVLSKAMLLAEDKKIKDKTITSQIKR